jgi:hypothetical protein
MSLIRIPSDPSRRQLAVFGAAWLISLTVVGILLLARTGSLPLAASFWAAAVLVPLVGGLIPGLLRAVYLGTHWATFPVGLVMSYVVLGAVYYLVLAPTGLVMRLWGYDPLGRRFDRSASSYWSLRKPAPQIDRYFRQF